MKKLLLVATAAVLLAGCGEIKPIEHRYPLGAVVRIVVNGRKGQVIDHCWGAYSVRYADDLGKLHYAGVGECELAPWVNPPRS